MMKNINDTKNILLIFADSSVKKRLADADELCRLLQNAADERQENVKFFVAYARSLSYYVGNDGACVYDHENDRDLKDYDFVYFRKAGSVMQQMLACAIYLRMNNVPYFDTEIGRATSRNKLSQMFALHERGISVPTTLFCRKRRYLVDLLQHKYKDIVTFPVIAKATGGTRGDANFLVKDIDELKELLVANKRHFLIQPFVPNEGDYRVFVVAEAVRGIIGRTAQEGSHLNNTSKNGSAAWLPDNALDLQTRMIAVRAAQVCGRDIAGVDILVDSQNGTAYVLEVNRAPQIEHASYPEQKAVAVLEGVLEALNEYETIPDATEDKQEIGRKEHIAIEEMPEVGTLIAKVDTGAYTNALHCPYAKEHTDESGRRVLYYSPFEDRHTVYQTENYFVKKVTSSNGVAENRYVISVNIRIGDRVFPTQVSLTDRSSMNYPFLIGRKLLRKHGLVVNVAKRFTQ